MSGPQHSARLLLVLAAILPGGALAAHNAAGTEVLRTGSNADCVTAKSTPVASIPFNPFLLAELSPPVVGPAGTWRARLQTGLAGQGVAYLVAARSAGNMRLPGGVLLVDMRTAVVLQVARFGHGETVLFNVPIPDDEDLCGQRVRVQAVIVDARGTTLTNAFDLTLGR